MKIRFSVQTTNLSGLVKNVFNVQLCSTSSQENVWNVKKDFLFILKLTNANPLNHLNLISSICSMPSSDQFILRFYVFFLFSLLIFKRIKKIENRKIGSILILMLKFKVFVHFVHLFAFLLQMTVFYPQ